MNIDNFDTWFEVYRLKHLNEERLIASFESDFEECWNTANRAKEIEVLQNENKELKEEIENLKKEYNESLFK